MARRCGIHPTAVIGSPPEMREWVEDDAKPFLEPIIHRTALLNAFVTVDSGCDRPTEIGPYAILMAKVHVGHDAIIGANCELAPGVVIGGYCRLDTGVKMGVNSSVRPLIKIGAGSKIGAGAVVVQDVPENEVWGGVPAKKLK